MRSPDRRAFGQKVEQERVEKRAARQESFAPGESRQLGMLRNWPERKRAVLGAQRIPRLVKC